MKLFLIKFETMLMVNLELKTAVYFAKKNNNQIGENHFDTIEVSENMTFKSLIPKSYHDNMTNNGFTTKIVM